LHGRLEVLAALANAVLLFGVAIYILYEAYERFRDPPPILSPGRKRIAVGPNLGARISSSLAAKPGYSSPLGVPNCEDAYGSRVAIRKRISNYEPLAEALLTLS